MTGLRLLVYTSRRPWNPIYAELIEPQFSLRSSRLKYSIILSFAPPYRCEIPRSNRMTSLYDYLINRPE
ncbi:uncharacterized protein LACBIDRAFT_302048 [Laccaria bicolor S238N-H82]|uniref:Predicted protein n=1 Tax=Laccaria bicolor (strain S238N-H82 / ATCC MYA-4686) TaxID=486041 RepID=B0CQM9_LACBS|nr:uncharacterized protein LACBIDRAFT_302048 [Laccaria bicolor S238N-H82]EDR16200.1 predicted protein [Laccaria bicolor S238N-H82]|eukprot:XP_001874408.1 predicted protein [Laccaria bicolor S238N-H82]